MADLVNRGPHSALSAVFQDGHIILTLESGREVRFPVEIPVEINPRLARGTPEQLSRIELSPYGIHWPELDEEFSFEVLLNRDYGQRQKLVREH